MELPEIPATLEDFIPHFSKAQGPGRDVLQPYIDYEAKLREIYAQQPQDPRLELPYINAVPVFAGHTDAAKIHARDLDAESQAERERYLLALPPKSRRANDSAAIVPTKRDFETNFDIFTESSLRHLDWSNVVAAGSAVVTSLLPVDHPHNESRRSQRTYYNEELAPASDVDLFLYGLDEETAIKKLHQIELKIRDSLLCETTSVRTKNAVTIVSQYPIRHIQVVLRLYKSVSEILTGFDVDCSCVAYDGSQVWATPRAISAFMTQTNIVDLTRRSPSYESRLSKYSRRGFEAYCPFLDRSQIDPTIFERSFNGVTGLARLLVLEALPTPEARDEYREKRREERGRPEVHGVGRWNTRQSTGNIKEEQPDEISDWIDEEDVSNYHTFTIPYGPNYNAKKIEKLLFAKDMLLNAEWNRKDREVDLHRHPAFLGYMKDVVEDCCGFCPAPTTEEEVEIAEEEAKIYTSGKIEFVKDDPGRQAIGSFRPLTADDWTEMAYIGNTAKVCQAIVDSNLEQVQQWCQQPGTDVNRRDHTGRTPLHLAASCSTPEIVQCLLDNGARIIARLADGLTAFHIAVRRGNVPMVRAMIERSQKNAAEEEEKKNAQNREEKSSVSESIASDSSDSSDEVIVDTESSEDGPDSDTLTQGSFVKVTEDPGDSLSHEEDGDSMDPDIIDPNTPAWDYLTSPLHLAIMGGHVEIVTLLVDQLHADTMLPVLIRQPMSGSIGNMVLNLVLAARFASDAPQVVKELHEMGVPSSQADMNGDTVINHLANDENVSMVRFLHHLDPQDSKRAINHITLKGISNAPSSPLMTSIKLCNSEMALQLLECGAPPNISFEAYLHARRRSSRRRHGFGDELSAERLHNEWEKELDQPIIAAILNDMPQVVQKLLDAGADINEVTAFGKVFRKNSCEVYNCGEKKSVLELVQSRTTGLRRELSIKLKEPKKKYAKPDHLDEDDNYLKGFEPGSYQFCIARSNLQLAKVTSAAMHEKYETKIKEQKLEQEEPEGYAEKREAMQLALETFENVERYLLDRHAKTHAELYPGNVDKRSNKSKKGNGGHSNKGNNERNRRPYQTIFKFKGTAPDAVVQRGYLLLFQAAWEGDLETVKALTMSRWTLDENSKLSQNPEAVPGKQLPLEIAIQDFAGFTPFSIAALRGHFDLARLTMEIAEAQYEPPPESDADDSDASDGESDVLRVASRVVEEPTTFTVGEPDDHADAVTSRTSPLELFEMKCEPWRLFDSFEDAQKHDIPSPREPFYCGTPYLAKKFGRKHFFRALEYSSGGCSEFPISYAVVRDDAQLFSFLMETGQDLTARERERDNGVSQDWKTPDYCFNQSVCLGRIAMMEQTIRATASMLPLSNLAQKYGVQEDYVEKPKFYLGLSVHGKKRKDWVAASRNMSVSDDNGNEDNSSPLEQLVEWGNLDSIKWFMSGAPLQSYMAYAKKHQDDKRIQALQKRTGGIKPIIENWMRERSFLALRTAVERAADNNKSTGPFPVLEYLLTAMPQKVNSTTYSNDTLLQCAAWAAKLGVAKLLMQYGADPLKRNAYLQNILHMLLSNIDNKDAEDIEEFFNLFDRGVVEELLTQRSSAELGSQTPILLTLYQKPNYKIERIIHFVLSYSKGRDLEMMDASGEYPLHYAIREGWTHVARILLEYRPSLLYLENAVGLTPLDIINNAHLHTQIRPEEGGYASRDYAFVAKRENPAADIPESSLTITIPMREDKYFIPERIQNERKAEEDSLENTWRLCNEMALAYPEKRKLVSLLDANEVIKRLAVRRD